MRYRIPGIDPATKLAFEYNYASGDRNPADGIRGTFDQLYPSNHDKYGLDDLIGWRNLRHLRAALEVQPRRSLQLAVQYSSFWRASGWDGLYSISGAPLTPNPNPASGLHIGQEADARAVWKFTGFASVGLGYGRLVPGQFLTRTTAGIPYNLVFCYVGTKL